MSNERQESVKEQVWWRVEERAGRRTHSRMQFDVAEKVWRLMWARVEMGGVVQLRNTTGVLVERRDR